MQPKKWQRNPIYDAVVAGGLDPSECTFDYDDVEWRVTHVPSQSYFLIKVGPGLYTTTAVVGDNLPWPGSYTWTAVPDRVQRWAEEVKRDVDTPDLWAELRRRQGFLTGAGYEDAENAPFGPDEQTQILVQLREVMEFVRRTDSITEAQALSMEAKLNDLAAAAARVGRKDWLLMVGGAILSMILGGDLPYEAVWDIIEMMENGLGRLFGGNGLPQLPPQAPPAPPPVV